MRIPQTRYPHRVEAAYRKILLRLVAEWAEITLYEWDLIKRQIENELVTDDITDVIFFARRQVNVIKGVVVGATEALARPGVERFLNTLSSANKTNVDSQLRVAGINPVSDGWLCEFIKDQIRKNVSYVTNIRDDYTQKVEQIILNGLERGESTGEISENLIKQIGMARNKARFIARDQTGTLYGQLTFRRHQQAGIEEFEWSDSGDEDVRDTHQELNGQIFSYSDPPDEGLPGEPYRCRCVALPKIKRREQNHE